ncbi:MAG: HipA N-terminal domain-containing protein [Candidatus Marinimicrobia bacterium]|nr:HipA N-terminal domain-containing protein [Candidatus Neomarinimicrobiota bacterium]
MRAVKVYRDGDFAGILSEENLNLFIFKYDDIYYHDNHKPALSLTLPKTQKEYRSEYLSPFFFNMLSEGVNKTLQCNQFRIDEDDDFALLMATAQCDTVGAVTVKPIEEK